MPDRLTLNSRAGVRPHAIFHVEQDEETVTVAFGGHVVTLPAFTGDAVRAALNGTDYCPRDPPGELDDGGKPTLVRRLIREGLVVARGFDGCPEPVPDRALSPAASATIIQGSVEIPETAMSLREQFTDQLKVSMKAGTAPRTSTLRMMLAKLKDTDIASRPKGIDKVPDDEVLSMLRGMVKSRRESVEMYRQGNRLELAAKEEAEIAVIEAFLPQQLDDDAIEAAVAAAIAEAGAASIKDMGKVMAALRAKHAAALDMGKAGPIVKARLSA